jgi:hypothetical protein
MTKYENGYSDRIKYWAKQYNEAFKANDVDSMKTSISKLDYFTKRHCAYITAIQPAPLTVNQTPIAKGSIVKFNQGWCRVTRVTKNTVNLGPIFGRGTTDKYVPIDLVTEDSTGFYVYWSTTDAYRSM